MQTLPDPLVVPRSDPPLPSSPIAAARCLRCICVSAAPPDRPRPPASARWPLRASPRCSWRKLAAAGLPLVQEFAIDCSYGLFPEELRAKISLCDALIVRSGTKVGRDVFEASGGRLRVIGRMGVGIDSVDLTAAIEHDCLVINAPTANTVAAAEHGIALMCAMAPNIAQADTSLKAGELFYSLI
ncbi:hypothetical protein ZWY2020_049944 [Hordeum vulgare]|nr:hypothetical protein ZWY2020_049944 [Hordeum vulgare]